MSKFQRILKFLVCIGLITAFLGCAATKTSQSTGEYVDDTTITTKVKAAIFEDPTLKTLQITVVTFKGEVQLSGFVDSAQSVTKAGQVARSVKGVTSVKNDLVVKATDASQSPGEYLDDTTITTKVKAAIVGDPTLKSLQIGVTTRNGVVQLSGFVDSAQSVTKAGEVARSIKGVTSVQNDLIVK